MALDPDWDSWKPAFAQAGFRPYGSFGGMRIRVEDVEFVATRHPLKGVAVFVQHFSNRIIFDDVTFLPVDATIQEVGLMLVRMFELVHPERKGKP